MASKSEAGTVFLGTVAVVLVIAAVAAVPALSMDRLEIHYADNKRVLVSPKGRNAFCQAIGFDSRPSA